MNNVSFILGNGKNVPTGTPLGVKSILEVLKICEDNWNKTIGNGEKYNKEKQKGKMGSIFAYTPGPESTTVKLGTTKFTDGVIFMDFDKVPRQIINEILERFDDIAAVCSPLLGIKTSSSYADDPAIKPECGFHVFFLSNPLCGDNIEDEYKELAVTGLALFCHCVKKITGHELRRYVDSHNVSIKQRLFLNPAKCRYNELACPLTENTIKTKDLTKLKENYPEIFIAITKDNVIDNREAIVSGKFIAGKCESKRTEYPVYLERCAMINTAAKAGLERDDVVKLQCIIREEFGGEVDDVFIKEIKACYSTAVNHKIKNLTQGQYDYGRWLYREFGHPILSEVEKAIEIPDGKYLSDYSDLIIKQFEEHKRIFIQAPTGAGKTVFISNYAVKMNDDIVVPFNSMLSLYCKDGEDVDGNKIPSKITEISSNKPNPYNEYGPNCMIWDKAQNLDLKNKNKTIIFDESHEQYMDGTYRDSAINMMELCKELKSMMLVSATPAGEPEELGLHKIIFTKKRDTVPVRFVNCKDSGGYIFDLLENRDLSTKYLVFSDMYAMRLHKNFPGSCLLHSKMKDTEEFKYVLEKEELKNDITFCTTIALNGLNIKENGDVKGKYRIIVEIKEGKDVANKIIQAVGRIRDGEIVEVVVVFTKQYGEKQSVAERAIDEKGFKEINEKNNGVSIIAHDERFTEEKSLNRLLCIEKYVIEHSTKESIISDLMSVDYFSVNEEYDYEKHSKLEDTKKKEANVKFKELIKKYDGCIENIDYNELDEYSRPWYNSMVKLGLKVHIDWVDALKGKKDACLMDTIIKDIQEKFEASRLTDEEYELLWGKDKLEEVLNWKDENGNKLSDIAKKKFLSKFERMNKHREKWVVNYRDKIDAEEQYINDFLQMSIITRKGSLEKKAEAGKKGGKKGKSITIQDSKGNILQFDTIKDAAEEFNVSVSTMRKYIKKGKFERVIEVRKQTYIIVNE